MDCCDTEMICCCPAADFFIKNDKCITLDIYFFRYMMYNRKKAVLYWSPI